MTMDKSLVSRGRLTRHRNVLSRAERIALLEEEGKWKEEFTVFGLPKVRNIKVKQRKAAKAEKEAVAAPVEGAEAAAPGAAAPEAGKPEKGEKAAKPEKGEKAVAAAGKAPEKGAKAAVGKEAPKGAEKAASPAARGTAKPEKGKADK
jgi:small basic protein (TIGR04137 family)